MARGRGPSVEGIFDFLKRKPAGGQPPPGAPPPPGPKAKFDPRVDYYGILGVPPGAPDEEIRAAFRNLGRRYHPDRDPSPEAARFFQAITEAYAVLTDERARADYDRARGAAPPPPRPPPPPTGAIIVPPPTAPAMPSLFEAFRPPPPPAPPAAAPPAAPRRPPTMWEVMFGPPEELTKTPAERPTMFDPYAPGAPPLITPPPIPPAPRPAAPAFRQPLTPPPVRPGIPTAPSLYALPQPPPEIFPTPGEMAEFIQASWPLDPVWDFVREHRDTPEFRRTGTMVVDRFAGLDPRAAVEREASEWFGISKELVDDYERRGLLASAFWTDVLYRMFDIATAALEALKPRDLPGSFYISTDNLSVDLNYAEGAGRQPWK